MCGLSIYDAVKIQGVSHRQSVMLWLLRSVGFFPYTVTPEGDVVYVEWPKPTVILLFGHLTVLWDSGFRQEMGGQEGTWCGKGEAC